MSASIGMLGGARAQYHLRQTFIFLNMYPMKSPEVIVNFAQNKFDSNGKLIDEDIRDIEVLIRPICIYLLIDLAFSIARNRDIIVYTLVYILYLLLVLSRDDYAVEIQKEGL